MIGNYLKTALLLGALTGLMLLAGRLLAGPTGLVVALVFAVLMNFAMYWFSGKVVLMMYRAKEAPKSKYPKLHKIVEELAKKSGMPKPKIYIVPSPQPNAFATGRDEKNAVVACTEGILELLTDDELKGVLAHELSHVKNRDMLITTIAATMAGVISYIANMAQWAAIFGSRDDDRGGNIFGIIALAIITPIIAMLIQLTISRSREYLADERGAKTIGNGEPLARALEKIEAGVKAHPMKFGSPATSSLFIANPFSAGGLALLLSTHPSTKDRVARLKSMKI